MSELWRPSLDGTEEDPWLSVIYQAIGAASVCWIEQDGGRVFDSERAQSIALGLMAWIEGKEQR